MSMSVRLALAALLLVAIASGCSAIAPLLMGGGTAQPSDEVEQPGGDRYPDVLQVELVPQGDRVFDVRVTLSSPYDTPERYADGWHVLDPDGNVLGTHMLLHDHANEQPFTRTQRGLRIPAGVETVRVQGRDQANGYGGLSLTVGVPDDEG